MQLGGFIRFLCGLATIGSEIFSVNPGHSGFGFMLIIGGYLLMCDGVRMWRDRVVWM
jgi:hypothetical protein